MKTATVYKFAVTTDTARTIIRFVHAIDFSAAISTARQMYGNAAHVIGKVAQ